LRFSLKYDGPLFSSSDKNARVKNKNYIRWYLADQVAALIMRGDFSRMPEGEKAPEKNRGVLELKKCFFMAAISKGPIACNLAIRIERRGALGSLFEHEGDLDNRL
jgi:hypothetical protein